MPTPLNILLCNLPSFHKQYSNEKPFRASLKGLGHAILGNFSIDQMVIELTELTKEWLKTTEELKQNTGKLRRDKDGQNWGGMKWIAFL